MGGNFALVLVIISATSFTFIDALILHDIPSYIPIKKCHRFSPDIGKCLLEQSDVIRPFLVKGIPELRLNPIDPMHIPEVKLEQGTRALNFKTVLKNIIVKGLRNYKITRFDFDVPNLQWFLELTLDALTLEGNHVTSGRLLVADVEGNGTFSAGIEKSKVISYHKVRIEKKRGQDFITPIITNVSLAVEGPSLILNGLFGGDSQLAEVTNRAIKENALALFDELKPVFEDIISKLIEGALLASLEDLIPFDVLYPPLP